MIKSGKIYISLFIIPLIIAAYMTGTIENLCVSYITVTLHELAHLAVALYLKIDVSSFVIMPFGVSLRLKDRLIDDPKKECIICAAGPLCNLLLIALSFFARGYISPVYWEYVEFFIYSNASVFLINVAPIIPLDGGRIARSLLTHVYGFTRAAKISHVISQINIGIIGLFSLYILCVTHFNVSAMLLCAFLIFNMSSERKNDTLTVMRQIIYSKEKLARREIMNIRQIAATQNVDAKRLLKSFSYNCYYLVSIMDKNGRICATVSETQIIDALSSGDGNKKLKHFI